MYVYVCQVFTTMLLDQKIDKILHVLSKKAIEN